MSKKLTQEQQKERKQRYYELKGRGYTDKECAEDFQIAYCTFRNWKKTNLNRVQETLASNEMPTNYDRYWAKFKDAEGNKITVSGKGGEINEHAGVMEYLESIKFDSPKFPKVKRIKRKNKVFAVIDPADIHLQKISRADKEHNITRYVKELNEACDTLLSTIAERNPSKIILVIGNDVLHVDGESNTTTRGTRQDSADLWFRAYNMAFSWYKEIILKAMQVADVHVVFNKSNHDRHLGYCLAHCLEKYFENSKNVTFDCATDTNRDIRTYFIGGAALAFSHGDCGKPAQYAQRMPFALKGGFDKARSFHFYLHHRHHAEQFAIKDFGQVTVETVRSPSVEDVWHGDSGYDSLRCISAFIHDLETGFQTDRINYLFKS